MILYQDLGTSPTDFFTIGSSTDPIYGDQYRVVSFHASANYILQQVGVALEIGAGTPLTSGLFASIWDNTISTLFEISSTVISNTLTSSSVYYNFLFNGVPLINTNQYALMTKISTVDTSNYAVCGEVDTGIEYNYYSVNGVTWQVDSTSITPTIRLYGVPPISSSLPIFRPDIT